MEDLYLYHTPFILMWYEPIILVQEVLVIINGTNWRSVPQKLKRLDILHTDCMSNSRYLLPPV